MLKLMTPDELQQHQGITLEDKILIERILRDEFGSEPENELKRTVRAYLVSEFVENEINDEFRADLSGLS